MVASVKIHELFIGRSPRCTCYILIELDFEIENRESRV